MKEFVDYIDYVPIILVIALTIFFIIAFLIIRY